MSNSYKVWSSLTLLFFVLFSCQKQEVQKPTFTQVWKTIDDFVSPESVLFDSLNQFMYVSNGVGFKQKGEGFISKLSATGDVLDLKWIDGLNRPTGMAIHKGILFVIDINKLLKVDILTGKIVQRLEVEEDVFLNDIAISKSGSAFITASNQHSVYQLDRNQLNIVFQDSVLLQYANGIGFLNQELLVAGMGLTKINLQEKTLTSIPLPDSLSDFDGLVVNGKKEIILTQVLGKGKLSVISNDLKSIHSFENASYLADFDHTIVQNSTYLFIASGNHEKKEYSVTALKLN